jgi:hypothetical protein
MIRSTVTALTALAALAVLAGAPAETHDALWVSQRVREWQPTARDRTWETIGWAHGLSEALRLGRDHARPIFLFTHDGRLDVGRC